MVYLPGIIPKKYRRFQLFELFAELHGGQSRVLLEKAAEGVDRIVAATCGYLFDFQVGFNQQAFRLAGPAVPYILSQTYAGVMSEFKAQVARGQPDVRGDFLY